MTLVAPKLDDRRFQDIVNEAKKRIPHYCKEWTDHNVSDPGVTLIELFAWMTDIILYRQNQIPDRHYIKFLDMMGITLKEPTPAQVPVTFWLSAPQDIPAVIPAGTEVASTQTETQRSIIFTTNQDFEIHPPELSHIRTRVTDPQDAAKKGFKRPKSLRSLLSGFESNILQVFSPVPQVDDALYFGFKNDLSRHVLRFDLDFDQAIGAGIDPSLPPYVWEASTGQDKLRWESCDIEIDTTKGMNAPGRIQIHLPSMGTRRIDSQDLYWVRVRIKEISASQQEEGMRPYQESPKLRQVQVTSIGGTVEATHAQVIQREFLGQSDGSTGQRFFLQNKPLLARNPAETLVVQVEGEFQTWTEVNDFGASNSFDKHFTLDGVTGELRLGPAIRQQDGTIKLYGAIPPQGANLFFDQYRFGGGQIGNVGAGILNTLKSAIPYISRVSNRASAWGGLDPESLESAMMRAPALLRSRERAVTESDYEFLALEALPTRIGRVKCLQPRPATRGRIEAGQIFVLIIPRVPRPHGYIEPELLTPNEADVSSLTAYLDERRLLTTQLNVRAPEYEWVSVKVFLRPVPGAADASVEAQVLERLYRFLNPLAGGPQGKGWPFGHSLFVSEVYQCLQGISEVQFIRGVELYSARPSGEAQGDPVESIELLGHGIIASGIHAVEFV